MPAHLKYLSRLDSLFRRKRAALLDDLRAALGTASRTTIFRILRAVGYFTSYSHAGRYYTLRRIPEFDGKPSALGRISPLCSALQNGSFLESAEVLRTRNSEEAIPFVEVLDRLNGAIS